MIDPSRPAGYVLTLNTLGVFYANGMGMKQDVRKAREYWQRAAAEVGNEVTQEALKGLDDDDAQ